MADERKPIAFRVTCFICGEYAIAAPSKWVDAHLRMRQHVYGKHQDAEYDLDGEKVVHGYGWTDNYVAVLALMTSEETKHANIPTEQFMKEA